MKKKLFKAQEYIADHVDSVQYPKPFWLKNEEARRNMPWTTRVLLVLFGILAICFGLFFGGIFGLMFYGAFS